jgi:hypothetical protein
MSEDEAKQFNVEQTDRRFFVRLDSAKVNIVPSRTATWFKLVSVNIGNATEPYPGGDEVQTVVPWTPPDLWKSLDNDLLNRILTDIDAGLPDGNRYSDAGSATDRAAWKLVVKYAPDKSEGQAREMIRSWVRNGVLVAEPYDNPVTRKQVKGLRVDNTKRPGRTERFK